MDHSVVPPTIPAAMGGVASQHTVSPMPPTFHLRLEDIASLDIIPNELVSAAFTDLESGVSRCELHPRRSNFTGAWMLDRCAPHGTYRCALATWLVEWAERYFRRVATESSAMETISA